MVTPTKSEIVDKAFENYHKQNHRITSVNPTESELKETGEFERARVELMRNDRSYTDYIESEAHKLGLLTDDIEPERRFEPNAFTVDLAELMRSGSITTGGRESGKTYLNFHIAEQLMNLKGWHDRDGRVWSNAQVFVLDPTVGCPWARKSSVPNVVRVSYPGKIAYKDGNAQNGKPIKNGTVFDMSMLTYPQRLEFAEAFCKNLMDRRKTSNEWPPTFVIFEEGHLYFYEGSMRSPKRHGNAVELVTTGGNCNISYGVITQYPSMIDKLLIKITRQRWFGYTSEPNDLAYIEDIIGKEKAQELCMLEVGEFVYSYPKRKNKPKVIKVPKFERKRRILTF